MKNNDELHLEELSLDEQISVSGGSEFSEAFFYVLGGIIGMIGKNAVENGRVGRYY